MKQQIEHIVFDLGGVLLNLDFSRTKDAFTGLGVKDFDSFFTQVHSNPLFKSLETGASIDSGFYDAFRTSAAVDADDNAIDTAWNAMLLDFPPERIERIKELSKQHKLYIFSNTNAIHYNSFIANFESVFGYDFNSLFTKTWYSQIIGYRKPDVEAFKFIIRDGALNPGTTLFIDDTLPNVEAARIAGLHAAYLQKPQTVLDVLDEWL